MESIYIWIFFYRNIYCQNISWQNIFHQNIFIVGIFLGRIIFDGISYIQNPCTHLTCWIFVFLASQLTRRSRSDPNSAGWGLIRFWTCCRKFGFSGRWVVGGLPRSAAPAGRIHRGRIQDGSTEGGSCSPRLPPHPRFAIHRYQLSIKFGHILTCNYTVFKSTTLGIVAFDHLFLPSTANIAC